MKERPILFNGEMVRAILDGSKTETRRPITSMGGFREFVTDSGVVSVQELLTEHPRLILGRGQCPHGEVGDRLWVREAFVLEATDGPLPDRPHIVDGVTENEWGRYIVPHYRATEPEPNIVDPDLADDDRTRWSPSIFMPRWACRIVLEITRIDVQRLQDMTQQDAKADGAGPWWLGGDGYREIPGGGVFELENVPEEKRDYLRGFRESWEPIYRKRGYGWDANPWVWVIGFRRVAP